MKWLINSTNRKNRGSTTVIRKKDLKKLEALLG